MAKIQNYSDKKGDKKGPSNYRDINLLSTTLKLTTRVMARTAEILIGLFMHLYLF